MNIRTIIPFLFLVTITNCMFCNYFPLNPKACVTQTSGIMCQYSQFENACISVQQQNIGCNRKLNKMACLYQLKDVNNNEQKCYFRTKCLEVRDSHLTHLGCSQDFSKYACTNVKNAECIWIQDKCSLYAANTTHGSTCSTYYNYPVVPSLCSKISDLRCKSGGFANDYQCQEVTDKELSTIKCSELGLSQISCMQIQTDKTLCVFKNNQCYDYVSSTTDTCDLIVNQQACYAITTMTCTWTKTGCKKLEITTQQCADLVNVNPTSCLSASGLCLYNDKTKSCYVPVTVTKLTCDTEGINEKICMSIDEACTFYLNKCQSIKTTEYDIYSCDMKLNQKACINITTKYQYCQWDGSKCQTLLITQDLPCTTLSNVNGNSCQAILKDGCVYDSTNHKCISSTVNDACTSGYLNLVGCVSITTSTSRCQWSNDQCKAVNILQYQTKCADLGFANSIACSAVLEEGSGCYFNSKYLQCQSFTVNTELGCRTTGLNQSGCARITKTGERCRWSRGACTAVTRKEEVSKLSCLSLQNVNAAICALVEGEACKFNSEVSSCVSSVDGKFDDCTTSGLNNVGCAMISKPTSNCIYDTVNWVCKSLNLGGGGTTEEQQATKDQLASATCTGNSPTINVCAAITKNGELCSWSDRLSKCINQQVFLNSYCLEYNQVNMNDIISGIKITVNANVCSAVEMNLPDTYKQGDTVITNAGYCQYNTGTKNCEVYTGTTCPGTDKCCSNLAVGGINTHVCSKFSDPNTYCYFNNDLKCVELTAAVVDITSDVLVQNYYNTKRYKCSQMNKKSCHMIEWSKLQWCYNNGNSCMNINILDYPNLKVFTDANAITNRYLCNALEAVDTAANDAKYFSYDETNKRCKEFSSGQTITCSQTNINFNACTRLTKDDYCLWDRATLECGYVTLASVTACDQLVNEKTCYSLDAYACVFRYTTDKCEFMKDKDIDCDYYKNGSTQIGTVSAKTCASITKDGQSCRYDVDNRLCTTHTTEVDTCDVQGANAIACYNYTSSKCIWNPNTLTCGAFTGDIATLGCADFVNKTLCKQLTKEACEWDTTKLKCSKKTDFTTVNSAFLYNAVACTSITSGAYVYDTSSGQCIAPSGSNYKCSDMPMNQNSCLINTKGYKCAFDNTKASELKCYAYTDKLTTCTPAFKINMDLCADVIAACAFDMSDYTCKSQTVSTTTKCSNLASSALYYNKYSCSSISDTVTDQTSNTVCTDPVNSDKCEFEKYCQWDSSTYKCGIVQIGTGKKGKKTVEDGTDGEGNTIYKEVKTCATETIPFNRCQNIYSKAVCLQVIVANCFFDLTQGGCFDIDGLSNTVPSCSAANGQSCSKVTNPSVKCTTGTGSDYTPQCSIEFSTTTCVNYTGSAAACSSLTGTLNSSVCAIATDACYFNGSACSSSLPSGYGCETLGLSQTGCTSLGAVCTWTGVYCKYTEEITIPATCADVNSLTVTNRKPTACAKVAQQCKFDSTCTEISGTPACSSFGASDIVSMLACVNCTGGSYQYTIAHHCITLSTNIYACINLNKDACTTYTTGLYCAWQSNVCTELTSLSLPTITDCTVANKDACAQLNVACIIDTTCKAYDRTKKCDEIATANGNVAACSGSNNESCFWDETNNKCAKIDNATTYLCSQKGLNKNACLKNTYSDSDATKQYSCFYNETGTQGSCQTFSVALNSSVACGFLNKKACLEIKDKACGWYDSGAYCGSITILSTPTCTSFQNGTSFNLFNSYTCGIIQTTVAVYQCYFNANVCAAVAVSNYPCTQPGLNNQACIQSTIGYNCQYLSNKCTSITTFDQNCANTLSINACANQIAKCIFNATVCQAFTATYTTSAQVLANIGPGYTGPNKLSASVCASIEVADTYVAYDRTNQKCLDVSATPPTQSCSALGINKLACFQRTKQTCKYVSGNCEFIERSALAAITTCDTSLNWYSCTILSKVTTGCKFVGGVCTPQVAGDTCSSLATAHAQVGYSTCASRTDAACQFDLNLSECVLTTATNLSCTTTGLNKISCLTKTTSDLCIFDETQYVCSQDLDNSKPCTAIINSKKCWNVAAASNYCYFNSGACKVIPTGTNLTNCVKTFETNALACSQATDLPCSYDNSTNKCISGAPTVECVDNISLNSLGCQACSVNNKKLKWSAGKCIEIKDSELLTLSCTSSVNKFTCINITNPTQYCKYNGTICQTSTPVLANCATITNVNRGEFCELSTDVKCQFNATDRKCEEVTVQPTTCVRGMNQTACGWSTGKCTFGTYCYGPGDVVLCSQASKLIECVGITQEACKWTGTSCEKYDTTSMFCKDLSAANTILSTKACTDSKLENEIDACIRDTTTNTCKVIQPQTCDETKSQNACIRVTKIPCLWKNSECILYTVNQTVDTCSDMNTFGSERSCLDVRRIGQQCQFKNFQCLPASLATDCNLEFNYVACVVQMNVQCQWVVTSMNILTSSGSTSTTSYDSGQCKPYTDIGEQSCNDILSFKSCLAISKVGMFCVWTDSKCQQIKNIPSIVTIRTYTLINANACGLVTTESVEYNPKTYGCRYASSDRTCTTKGLNKNACISIKNMKCIWDDSKKSCTTQIPSTFRLLAVTSVCDQGSKFVSAPICAALNVSESCGFEDGKCITLTSSAKCQDQGVNYYGCMNIKSEPCMWVTDHCETYYPYTPCAEVPAKVNSLVCSYVEEDACTYDSKNFKCVEPTITSTTTCDQLGLNGIGCSQVDGCIFLYQKCQKPVGNVICSTASVANYQVCAQVIDKCKFNDYTNGCVSSSVTDSCSTKGLSALACTVLEGCQMMDGTCSCQAYYQEFPKCSSITKYTKCSQYSNCFFEVTTVSSAQDLTEYLKNSNSGVCRDRLCSDVSLAICNGYRIENTLCYLDKNQKCQSATQCSEIKEPSSDCINFSFNDRNCYTNGSQCTIVQCNVLNKQDCSERYTDVCYYDPNGTCKARSCDLMTPEQCLKNQCDYDTSTNKCSTQKGCSAFTDPTTCVSSKQLYAQCAWVKDLTGGEVCVNNGCRFMGKTQATCIGMQIGNQVCVLLQDSSCVACEEITDTCVCYSNYQQCKFNKLTQKCQSRSCGSYLQNECTGNCRYNTTANICEPKCEYIYTEYICKNSTNCSWHATSTLCTYVEPTVVTTQFYLPNPIIDSILIVTLIIFINI